VPYTIFSSQIHATELEHSMRHVRSAYNSLILPAPSQLANFHHPPYTLPATLKIPHLTTAGMGGQFAHIPSSYAASRFMRKNGTTSNIPAFITVALPHVLKIVAASSDSFEFGGGALGKSAKDAMVAISWWKCWQKGV
jgi:hypothetical protein